MDRRVNFARILLFFIKIQAKVNKMNDLSGKTVLYKRLTLFLSD